MVLFAKRVGTSATSKQAFLTCSTLDTRTFFFTHVHLCYVSKRHKSCGFECGSTERSELLPSRAVLTTYTVVKTHSEKQHGSAVSLQKRDNTLDIVVQTAYSYVYIVN